MLQSSEMHEKAPMSRTYGSGRGRILSGMEHIDNKKACDCFERKEGKTDLPQ